MKAPTIIIGVGGVGSDICKRVADMMPEHAPDSENVRFVIMDTDINTIRDLHRKGFHGTAIMLSDNMTVQKCRERLKDTISSWYPAAAVFDGKSMTEGAGQQRAISRLALEYAVVEGKLRPLYQLVHELKRLAVENGEQQVQFYIISSLAGGTGSGIILPLSMYLNQFIMEESGDALSVCKGFFMLSSALKEQVDSELEQKSLDANAYAAVKELSYFMHRSDNEKVAYDDAVVPLIGWREKQLDEWKDGKKKTEVPESYEYCYLFGMSNENGKRIRSLEELRQMMAKAVYMQACSPIHDRNSSREDNKLRHGTMQMQKLREDKLRRFGGIGCGELIYPYEILKQYYALRWQKEVMEKQWQQYDKEYREKEVEYRAKRKNRQTGTPVDRGNEYIQAISMADSTDIFADEIRKMCLDEDGRNTWECYLEALLQRVKNVVGEIEHINTVEKETQEMMFKRNLEDLLSIKDKQYGLNVYNNIVEGFKSIKQKICELPKEHIETLSSKLFVQHPLEEREKWDLEYWLQSEGEFIHPNAVRYFLYNLKVSIIERKKAAKAHCNSAEEKWRPVETNVVLKRKRFGSYRATYREDKKKYKDSYEALYEYARYSLYELVLGEGERYIEMLINNYQNFFDSYEEMLTGADSELAEQEEKLDTDRGITRTYVCADAECREKMIKDMQKSRDYHHVNSGLSYQIYQLMFQTIRGQKQKQLLFENIKKYWVESMEQYFKPLIYMNILQAMDKENYYKIGHNLDSEGLKHKILEVENVLVAPFVQYINTQKMNQGISILCFNSELKYEKGRFHEVVKWMMGREAVDDLYYCSPYEIVFYRSFVGMDSFEVREYLHGSEYTQAQMGQAFLAYEEVIADKAALKEGEQGIMPHIDQEWNNLKKLPDPKKDYKELQIATAFLYAHISGIIKYTGPADFADSTDWNFTLQERIEKRKTLAECFDYLFENQYWLQLLLKELYEHMESDEEFLEDISTKGEKMLETILLYNASADAGSWDEETNRILFQAMRNFMYELSGRDDEKCCEAIEESKKEFKQAITYMPNIDKGIVQLVVEMVESTLAGRR